jgi:hypothetical protein
VWNEVSMPGHVLCEGPSVVGTFDCWKCILGEVVNQDAGDAYAAAKRRARGLLHMLHAECRPCQLGAAFSLSSVSHTEEDGRLATRTTPSSVILF